MSTDSGLTWSIPPSPLNAFCMVKTSAGLFAGSNNQIYFSDDTAHSWNNVYAGAGGTSWVFSMCTKGDSLFASTHGDGILFSPDNGVTWTARNNGLNTLNCLYIYCWNNTLYAGTYGNGLYKSVDNGLNWTSFNNGFFPNSSIVKITSDANYLYAISNNKVYRSSGSNNWIPAADAPAYFNNLLCIDNVLLAGGIDSVTSHVVVYRSFDNGATWQSFSSGIPTGCVGDVQGWYATDKYIIAGFDGVCNGIEIIDRTDATTSIKETAAIKSHIFLNPSKNEITFSIDNTLEAQLVVYDISGRSISEQLFKTSITMSLHSLTAGIYIYEISAINGGRINGKFVKE